MIDVEIAFTNSCTRLYTLVSIPVRPYVRRTCVPINHSFPTQLLFALTLRGPSGGHCVELHRGCALHSRGNLHAIMTLALIPACRTQYPHHNRRVSTPEDQVQRSKAQAPPHFPLDNNNNTVALAVSSVADRQVLADWRSFVTVRDRHRSGRCIQTPISLLRREVSTEKERP